MRLTIGIPFFNAEATLVAALQSVFAQTLEDWELLLVNDGSRDSSPAIARRVRDPRVRVLSDGANRGLARRLNEIAAFARGEYLARMDADDLMHPDRLARQLAFLDANPGVDVVGTATYSIDAAGQVIGVRAGGGSADLHDVLPHGLMIHGTVMGRTAWFRQNPYDGGYVGSEDHELWCRTSRRTTFARFSEPLYFYREVGCFEFGKYQRTCRTDRRIFRTYGPAGVGLRDTASLFARSFLKQELYRVLAGLGAEGLLIRRRNRPVTADERCAAGEALQQIAMTPVPGLTTPAADSPLRRYAAS